MTVVRKKLKQILQMHSGQDFSDSNDENEELWADVTLDEMDMDFRPVTSEPCVDEQETEPGHKNYSNFSINLHFSTLLAVIPHYN